MKKTSKALASTAALCLVLSTSSAFAAENTTVAPERLAGANRVDTAIKIAEKSFNDTWKNSGKAILSAAADSNLVDSLAVAPLSYQLKAPILLNDAKDTINADTLKALKDNKVNTVYIATGEGVISNKAKAQLEKEGIHVERLGGKNRYETAKNILDTFKKNGGEAKNVALVSGTGLADALSVAPQAAKSGMPILLTDGKDAVAANLAEVAKAAETVYAIGGNGVISDALVQQLKADRISGQSRYETNAAVIKKFAGDKEFSKIYLGNGQNAHLVDSLTGSVLAAQSGSPIVLADKNLSDATKDALKGKVSDKTGVVALGGETVVSNEVVKETSDIAKITPEYVAADKAVKAYEDAKIGTADQITAAKALKAPAVKAVEAVKDASQKSALEARIAAKDKAIKDAEAKMEVKVESVKAVNAREIKVVFNREVTEDTAENETNYTVYLGGDKDGDKLKNDEFEAELQDDNKTVIINLYGNKKDADGKIEKDADGKNVKTTYELKNKQSYRVDVKNVVDTNYKKMKDFTGEYTIFNDEEAPELLKCEYMGSMVKLTFNEPLSKNPTVKIDGKNIIAENINTNTTEAGEYTVEVKGLKDKNKEYGNHKVEIYNATDYAENSADLITTEYKATKENEKPVVEKIEEDSENVFKIKFNSAVKDFDNDHRSKLEIKKGNYTFDNERITIKDDPDEDYGYIVTLTSDDDKNPLYDDDEEEVSLNIKVKDFEGTNDVIGDSYTTTLKLTKDDSAPVVENDSANRVEGNNLVIVFNEDLDESLNIDEIKNKIHVKKDNVIKQIKEDKKELKIDGDKLYIPIEGTLEKGTYDVTLDEDTVKDKSGNKNEEIKTKVVYDGENEAFVFTGKDKDGKNLITVGDNGNNRNKITIDFGKKMDNSATILKNYKLAGVSLNAISGTTIGFKDGTDKENSVVEITLGEGSTEGIIENNKKESELKKLRISKDVKAEDGRYIADKNDNEFVSYDLKLTDDTKPEVEKVEYVKAKDGDTTTNTIKVTFSEIVKHVIDNGDLRNDFKVKDGKDTVDVKSVTFQLDPENDDEDKDCAIVVLSRNVNINTTDDSTITFKVTDDKDDNRDGIKVVDTSKFENKLKTTDTIKIKNVTKESSLISDGAKHVALNKINAYAKDGKVAPTLDDYKDAEVTEVTKDNLDAVNEAVKAAENKDKDIQEIVNKVVKEKEEAVAAEKAVEEAKGKVETAEYNGAQAEIDTAEKAKTKVKTIIDALNLDGVTYEIVDDTFTAAVAGDDTNETGTDGSYSFKVKLKKGSVEKTTVEKTLTVKATPKA